MEHAPQPPAAGRASGSGAASRPAQPGPGLAAPPPIVAPVRPAAPPAPPPVALPVGPPAVELAPQPPPIAPPVAGGGASSTAVSRPAPPRREEGKPPQSPAAQPLAEPPRPQSPSAQPPAATILRMVPAPPQHAAKTPTAEQEPPRAAKPTAPDRPNPSRPSVPPAKPQSSAAKPVGAQRPPRAGTRGEGRGTGVQGSGFRVQDSGGGEPSPLTPSPPHPVTPSPPHPSSLIPHPSPPIRPKNFLWAFPAEPPLEDRALPMHNAPAVDAQGRVLIFAQNRLSAVIEEQNKPRVVWDYVVGSHVPGRIAVGPDGNIRLHSGDGLLHCISPEGKQVFSPVQIGEPLGWAAPVVDRSGNTYASAYDGGLIRIGPDGSCGASSTAGPRRYLRLRRKFDSAAIVAGSVLYVGCEDPYLFAVALGGERGTLLWNHAAEQGFTGGFVNSSPALTADGIVVVAARDEHLLGFLPSGEPAFSTKVPGQMLGSPVIDRHGHVYVGVSQTPRSGPGAECSSAWTATRTGSAGSTRPAPRWNRRR